MLDINQALMKGSKGAPMKRKLPSASKKVASSTSASRSALTLRSTNKTSSSRTNTTQPSKHSSQSPERSSASNDTEPLALSAPSTQSYLDLGQESFGKHIMCRKCGLLYTAGEEEDEKEHQRFCKQRQRGITMTKWKNVRLIKAFPTDDARVIEIRRDDPAQHVKKMMEVKELLDDALGFVSESTFLDRGVFLFVKGKQVTGCATVERIEKAFIHTEQASQQDGGCSSDSGAEPKEVLAVMGICQIWVHPNHRGKRVASRLVDSIREKFIYGLQVPKHKVAFGQPTLDGMEFAKAYVKPNPVLVYEAAFSSSSSSSFH